MLSVTKAVSKIAILFLLALILLTGAGTIHTEAAGQKGKIITGVLNVRSGPGGKYPIVGKLLKGSQVVVLATGPEWLKISHGNLTGFISRKYVQLQPLETRQQGSTAQKGKIITGVLNVRSGPGRKYPIVGKLLKGSQVVVLATDPEWLKISHGSLTGFISRKYVQLLPIKTSQRDIASTESNALEPMENNRSPDREIGIMQLEDESVPSPFDPTIQPADLERMKQEADRIGNQITEGEAQVSAYTDKEAQLIDELDRLGRQLNRTKLQVKTLQREGTSIKTSLKETESEIVGLEKEIDVLDVYAAKRLVALYKLHQLGKMPVLASAESIFDLMGRKNALESILSADKAVWDELTLKKNRTETLRSTLAEQEQQYAKNIQALGEQLAAMNHQNAAYSKLLEEIRGKKSLMLAAIDSLKQAAFALNKQLDGNNWEIHPAGLSDGNNKKPFQSLKGLLQPPVPGKIIAFYGLSKSGKLESASVRNGIDIEAEPGEPIRAICGGSVIYADWFKGYGNLIIIDHGNEFCTVYAHAEEIFKAKGDTVDMDEVIGTVGDTGSLAGTKLYFEIRYKGKSIDPLAWLKRD